MSDKLSEIRFQKKYQIYQEVLGTETITLRPKKSPVVPPISATNSGNG